MEDSDLPLRGGLTLLSTPNSPQPSGGPGAALLSFLGCDSAPRAGWCWPQSREEGQSGVTREP